MLLAMSAQPSCRCPSARPSATSASLPYPYPFAFFFSRSRPRPAIAAPLVLAGLYLALAGGTLAQRIDPATLPARDTHEGVTVAADPYTDPQRSKERFGKKHPYQAGLLAVEVVMHNGTTRPIRVNLDAIRLLLDPPGNSRQRLVPLDLETVIEKILHKERGGPNPTVSRLPIPRPPKADRSKEWRQVEASLAPYLFTYDILPPQATVRGFFFFDMARRFEWVPHARVYVPELKFMDDGQALFFFEVDLAKATKQ